MIKLFSVKLCGGPESLLLDPLIECLTNMIPKNEQDLIQFQKSVEKPCKDFEGKLAALGLQFVPHAQEPGGKKKTSFHFTWFFFSLFINFFSFFYFFEFFWILRKRTPHTHYSSLAFLLTHGHSHTLIHDLPSSLTSPSTHFALLLLCSQLFGKYTLTHTHTQTHTL